jgi:hypothetical protein
MEEMQKKLREFTSAYNKLTEKYIRIGACCLGINQQAPIFLKRSVF